MPREFSRSDRVAAQIQREMAELLRTRIKAPELGMITLSDVELSRDLAVAKLYVSFLAAQLPPPQCVKRLGISSRNYGGNSANVSASGFCRNCVSPTMTR